MPVAQGEPEVEPDSVPDDIRRKSVVGIGNGLHGLNCYHTRRPICSLTCQCLAQTCRDAFNKNEITAKPCTSATHHS